MVKYIKCPRCELNYIDSEKQEYCDVCIAELKGKRLQFADLEEEDFEEIEAELESEELCPVCGVNHIRPGEKTCESCKQQQEYEEDDNVDLEEDDEDLTVDAELQEEIEEEFADEEEDEYGEPDDFFEGEDVDSLSDLEDDEFDDDDDDEDDDDDFDF